MRPWSVTLSDWLVDYYALATVVLAAAIAVMGRLRQPARRLAVARSAVVGLAMLAVLAALPGWPRAGWLGRPRRTQPDRPAPEVAPGLNSGMRARAQVGIRAESRDAMPVSPSLPAGRAESVRTGGAMAQPGAGPSVSMPTVGWTSDSPDLAGRAFVAGGALALVWLGIGLWQTTVLRLRSRPAPRSLNDLLASIVGDGRAAPDLLVSDRLAQPVAVGVLGPAIVLPERFVEDEPRGRLEAALAHEWAHLRNRDLWWTAVSGLIMPVLFAHPVYWWVRRRTREDQELLADAAAAKGRIDYAEALLSWATATPVWPRLAIAGSLALWERPSQLKRRIVMLLDRNFCVELTSPRWWRLSVRTATILAVLALSLLTLRPGAVSANPPLPPAKNPRQEPKHDAPAKTAGAKAECSARLLDPDGKPFAGAKVYRSDALPTGLDHPPRTAVLLGTTGPDGSFRYPQQPVPDGNQLQQVVVMAEGYGPAFVDPSVADGAKVLRLVKDDVPIRGHVIDIQGRPVAGATVQVVGLLWHPSAKLDLWLEALKTEKVALPVQYRMLRDWSSDDIPSLFPAVSTDHDGRFTLRGIGRERIVSLLVSGPHIETRFEYVATRDMPTEKVADFSPQSYGHDITYKGAAFELAAGPGLDVVGTVRDKDTGKPLAGVTMQNTALFGNPFRLLKTTTDAQGRYRILGLPPRTDYGDEQDILASRNDGPAYVPSVQHAASAKSASPLQMDFVLKRGAWARGRVIDQSTGKPVRASLSYYILEDNPYLKDYPTYGTVREATPFPTDENGEFQIAVMPGPGILGARVANDDTYRLGAGVDKLKGVKIDTMGIIQVIRARPGGLMLKNYNTVVEIDPKEGEDFVKVDIPLDHGRTLKGKLVGPEGEPVEGAMMMGAEDHFQVWSNQPLPSAEFEVHALGFNAERGLLFYHEAKQLAAAYVVKPGEEGPVTIRLERCGSLIGRLVDDGGLPRAGVQMTCDRTYDEEDSRFEKGALPSPIKTDKDGRFRASGLVPGLKYSLSVWGRDQTILGEAAKDEIVRAGESKNLGDVKAGD